MAAEVATTPALAAEATALPVELTEEEKQAAKRKEIEAKVAALKLAQKKEADQKTMYFGEHPGITCDGCGVGPLVGYVRCRGGESSNPSWQLTVAGPLPTGPAGPLLTPPHPFAATALQVQAVCQPRRVRDVLRRVGKRQDGERAEQAGAVQQRGRSPVQPVQGQELQIARQGLGPDGEEGGEEGGAERPVPMRKRQEVQEVLRKVRVTVCRASLISFSCWIYYMLPL